MRCLPGYSEHIRIYSARIEIGNMDSWLFMVRFISFRAKVSLLFATVARSGWRHGFSGNTDEHYFTSSGLLLAEGRGDELDKV